MAAALAECEAQRQAARAARGKAQPSSAQRREASAKAEQVCKALVDAMEADRELQAALANGRKRMGEASQADMPARAHAIEVQARTAAEAATACPRAATNDAA